jgi:hypothetical protein
VKPVRIDFVDDNSRLWAWLFVLAVAAALIGATATHWIRLRQDTAVRTAEATALQLQVDAVRKAQAAVTSPRLASTQRAAKLLQQDLNGVFAVVENYKEPGVRLRAIAIDVSGNTVRVEYDLDSVQKVSELTAYLNGGHERGPWKLESVKGARGTSQPQPTGTASAQAVFTAGLGSL